jgi:uncharacterized protein YndB with AHSA1/START domain
MTLPRPNEVVRHVVIRARRETVFRYFTDSERFAAWWGAGSRIDPRPGGALLIVYPGGTTASGEVKEVVAGERVVFSYGYDGPGKPIPPGGSTVEVTFADDPGGTRVTLRHIVDSEALARQHDAGWRYQLSLFAKVASADAQSGAGAMLDRWFAAWAEADAGARRAALAACTLPDVAYADDFGVVVGLDDLDGHIAATHLHMPGMKLVRAGAHVHTQGAALVPWQVTQPDGGVFMGGASFVDFAPDGRIARVVGFWGFEPASSTSPRDDAGFAPRRSPG